ncbi:MAG: hypothetical protein WKF55_01030 [Gemmatimonadaceae bacterium]
MSDPTRIFEVGDSVDAGSGSEHPAFAAIADARGKNAIVLYFLRAFT